MEDALEIGHAAEVADILLLAALKQRSRVIRIDPVTSTTHKVVFYRHGSAIASAFLPASLGRVVIERLRLLAEIEPLADRRQSGSWTLTDGYEEARLFCTTSGRGNGARAELWMLRSGEELPEVEGLARVAELAPGDMVGHLRIVSVLGEGGSGVVYRAQHVWLDRPCAIKVLRPECIRDAQAMDRFYREARLAALTEDRGTVAVNDVGTLPDGRPYLVMELIDGRSLAEIIREEGPLEPHRAVRLVREVARALSDLHQHGVFHCDVTPANIFVSGAPYAETVKIGDFGSAQDDDQPEIREIVFGTPLYMAPEQVRGARCDARTDLYALGCVFFEMLDGEPPFHGDTAVEVARKHLSAGPPAIRSPFEVLPPGVVEVVARLLQKDPPRRFQTAAALVEALGHVLSRTNRSTVRLWWQASA
ncbi:MAG TPA: serine/threonine-protein kinase [Kofleriaceae bacterium]|nr:serine/threonine-protein kinase [Kofleriaceae bacterium]